MRRDIIISIAAEKAIAVAVQRLVDNHGMKQKEVAEALGKSESWVSKMLSMAKASKSASPHLRLLISNLTGGLSKSPPLPTNVIPKSLTRSLLVIRGFVRGVTGSLPVSLCQSFSMMSFPRIFSGSSPADSTNSL